MHLLGEAPFSCSAIYRAGVCSHASRPGQGLTLGSPAYCFPSCQQKTLDTQGPPTQTGRQGLWPLITEGTAPLRLPHSVDIYGHLTCTRHPTGPGLGW